MSPLKLSLIAGFLAVLVTIGGHHHVQQGRLQEARRLRAENDRLRMEVNQRRQTPSIKGVDAGAGTGVGALDVAKGKETSRVDHAKMDARVPGTEYRNEGQATPVAAMQSLAWACDRGDAVLMESMIYFDESARPKARDYLAALPERVRAQWTTPEAMAAALLVSDGINRPYPVATIIQHAKTEELRPGRMAVLLPGTGRERIEYQETPAGWKYAITEAMVDNYIRRAAEQAKGTR